MLTGIDHVIIGVNNLEQATTTFSQKLGLTPSGGGKHPTGGTANRIVVIGDTYLELITIYAPEEAQQSMRERLAKGDGYLNCVFTSDNIAADSEAMRQRNITVVGPNEGQLIEADGRSRSWTRIDIERRDLTQRHPFIIQHDSTGEERRFKLAGWRTPPEHPLGAVKVISTTIAVPDLIEATTRIRRIYDLTTSDVAAGAGQNWNARISAFLLGESGQSIELAMPMDSSLREGQFPEPGALEHYLRQFGESLCRMTLGVKNMTTARRYLDTQQVAYTFFEKPQAELWLHPDQACGAAIVLREV
jgi:hypothetical protein